MIVRSREPFNAGPPAEKLRGDFLTPNELFFVRNHGAVPRVDASAFRLEVGGMGEPPQPRGLAGLPTLPRRRVVSALQCAGARRLEMMAVEPIPGELGWGPEALSNAE